MCIDYGDGYDIQMAKRVTELERRVKELTLLLAKKQDRVFFDGPANLRDESMIESQDQR